jgi:hypothetical protein
MSTLEDRLRDALRADADLMRPESVPAGPPPRSAWTAPRWAVPRRLGSRQTRVLIPVVAAAAVITLVTGLSLAASLLWPGSNPRPGAAGSSPSSLGPSPAPSGGHPSARLGPVPLPVLAADASRGVPASAPAPGVPRFYVMAYNAPSGGVNYLVVRDTATGRVTAQINPPAGHFYATVTAPSGDRMFVTAVMSNSGCSSRLYQFRLNPQGRPGPLVPLNITVPGNTSTYGDLTITPDGGTIGYATYLCNGEGEVGVIHLATRQVRVWAVDEGPGNQNGTPMAVSLSPDGSLVGYASFDGTSVLLTSAPTGSLTARIRLVSRTVIWAAIAGDDDTMYGCSVAPYRSGSIPAAGTLTYGRISVTGGGLQVIASWPHVTNPECYASLDPVGDYLLVQYPTVVPGSDGGWTRPAILDLHTGQLTDINAPAFYGPLDIAW